MWTVRQKQLVTLDAAQERTLVEDAAAVARAHWPHAARALGEARLQRRIRAVIRFAKARGIHERVDWLSVVNAAMALDDDFAPAPRLAWVAEILGDARSSVAVRMDRLADRVLVHLSAGPEARR